MLFYIGYLFYLSTCKHPTLTPVIPEVRHYYIEYKECNTFTSSVSIQESPPSYCYIDVHYKWEMSETHVFSKHSTNEYSSFIGHSYIHVTDVLWHKQCNKAHSGLTLLSCDWHKRVRIDYGNSGEWTVNYKISPWNLDMQKTWTALHWQLTEYTFLCPFNHKIAKLKKQHMNDNERLCHTHEGVLSDGSTK